MIKESKSQYALMGCNEHIISYFAHLGYFYLERRVVEIKKQRGWK